MQRAEPPGSAAGSQNQATLRFNPSACLAALWRLLTPVPGTPQAWGQEASCPAPQGFMGYLSFDFVGRRVDDVVHITPRLRRHPKRAPPACGSGLLSNLSARLRVASQMGLCRDLSDLSARLGVASQIGRCRVSATSLPVLG